MYSYARAVLYAFILWGITFLVTFLIYPLQAEHLVLFVTLRTLVMSSLSMLLTVMYFRDVEECLVRDGVKLGVIWLLTSIILDQGPFVWGLMQLPFLDYLVDIGLGYLLYPIVTVGAAFLLSTDKNTVEDSEASGMQVTSGSPPSQGRKEPLLYAGSDPGIPV